jgi:hypothetical protein
VTLDAASARFAEILIDDLHALMRLSQTNGAIDQAVLQLRTLLMLTHLVQGGLPHIDIGQFGTMRRSEPLVSSVRGDQHERSPFLARRGVAASDSSAPQAFGQSASASLPTGSAMGAEVPSEAGRMSRPVSTAVETQRDAEGLELPSRITSSARRARFALKCCINGISVRTLIRGRSGAPDTVTVEARSVEAIRIDRFRPSGNATTK